MAPAACRTAQREGEQNELRRSSICNDLECLTARAAFHTVEPTYDIIANEIALENSGNIYP